MEKITTNQWNNTVIDRRDFFTTLTEKNSTVCGDFQAAMDSGDSIRSIWNTRWGTAQKTWEIIYLWKIIEWREAKIQENTCKNFWREMFWYDTIKTIYIQSTEGKEYNQYFTIILKESGKTIRFFFTGTNIEEINISEISQQIKNKLWESVFEITMLHIERNPSRFHYTLNWRNIFSAYLSE